MIITLTANPSHDRTVALTDELRRGSVHRAASVTSQAGGKGVNISRASVAAGVPTLAVLPAPKDDPFILELLAAGIDCRPVTQAGDLRVNITISEPDGTTTKLNSPGPEMTAATRAAITETLRLRAGVGDWVVLAGSLPPGAPDEWYADLVTALADTGARVAVDTSDAPLKALVERLDDAAPHLMKPNGHELASFTGHRRRRARGGPGRPPPRAARDLVARGVETVLATLGSRGAVLVDRRRRVARHSPPTTVVSTVGAGDSSLFGYLLAAIEGRSPADRLALAVAYGSAAAGLPGTTIPGPQHVDPTQVTVTELYRPPRRLTRPCPTSSPPPWCVSTRRSATPSRTSSGHWPPWSATPAGPRTSTSWSTDAFAREETSATGLPGGIAIPHCRTAGVSEPTLAFARLEPGVDFGAKDGPADLVFLIAAPAGGDADHLQILTQLARALVKPAFTDALRAAATVDDVVELVHRELGLGESTADPGRDAFRFRRRGTGGSCRRASQPGRRHRLPDGDRPHLHGGRGPGGRGRARRGRPQRRDPGIGRLVAALPRHDRHRRRRHLRRRRGGARPRPLRRQAGRLLRGQATDRRRRRDDRRGAAVRRRPERPPHRGRGLDRRRRHRARRAGAAGSAGC